MIKAFSAIKSFIAPPFVWFRQLLESARTKNPRIFDFLTEFVKFAITMLGCFSPALITSAVGLAIGNLVLFSVLLTLQWATLTNKMYRRLEESRKQHEDDNNLLEGLYAEDEGRKIQAYQERAEKDASFLHDVVDFSHLVSDSVKKLTAELEMGVDGRGRTRVYDFLERSVIYLEELLSTLYERSIRISIKLAINDCTFKTYVRGKNNISSRGGQLKCKKKNQKRLKVSKNYAYKALVNKGLAFFAEGDLLHLHNIVGDGDKFYCEEEEFERLFLSTFIMTVRIPRYEEEPEKHDVIGLICIDSEHTLDEWSEKDFTSKVCYHIVADFADSIALLLKKLGG